MKNPDYTASAENLTNYPQVLKCLESLSIADKVAREAFQEATNTDAYKRYERLKTDADTQRDYVTELIKNRGGYQDVERGIYGLVQLRRSYDYKIDLVKTNLEPKIAQMCIIETVDKKAVEGLVKGGFITPEQDASIKVEGRVTKATIIQYP